MKKKRRKRNEYNIESHLKVELSVLNYICGRCKMKHSEISNCLCESNDTAVFTLHNCLFTHVPPCIASANTPYTV